MTIFAGPALYLNSTRSSPLDRTFDATGNLLSTYVLTEPSTVSAIIFQHHHVCTHGKHDALSVIVHSKVLALPKCKRKMTWSSSARAISASKRDELALQMIVRNRHGRRVKDEAKAARPHTNLAVRQSLEPSQMRLARFVPPALAVCPSDLSLATIRVVQVASSTSF